MPKSYIKRLLQEAKSLNWRYEEINERTIVLYHVSLPMGHLRITASRDNILGEVQKYAASFNRDQYFANRYQEELEDLEETPDQIPNAQRLLDEAKSAQFAVRRLASSLASVPEDPSGKKLLMRVGMTITVTEEEFKKIDDHTREGMDILRNKFISAAFHLSGECYSEDNISNHDPDEWQHGKISYLF